MTEIIAEHIAAFAAHAHIWGLLLIFVFMTVESSFIPFPSEVVMIPAGFLAFRGELLTGNFWLDAALAILSGTAGSLAGAYVNYYLALHLGRRALYRYGKYFFLSEKTLARAEQFFRDYGDIGTFVCRLLPGNPAARLASGRIRPDEPAPLHDLHGGGSRDLGRDPNGGGSMARPPVARSGIRRTRPEGAAHGQRELHLDSGRTRRRDHRLFRRPPTRHARSRADGVMPHDSGRNGAQRK